ncbi:MAG TPA: hypothetical protein VFJ77_04960 [Gaiellaceae bacterium]|nr:hypothetical protein [Gaiellaceae bacterium]
MAQRQSLFRDVNERIGELSDRFGASEQPLRVVCECGNSGCRELLQITAAEYEALRAHGRRFVVVPGHEIAGAERVVAANERFAVVEKVGAGGRSAARLDPRRDGVRGPSSGRS